MNTNDLKRFAQEARRKLLEQVNAKLNFVLNGDTTELRGKTDALDKLNKEISTHGREGVVDKVAYTWFNRLVALRYMDANRYQPIGMSVVSPTSPAHVSPEILSEAHRGNISDELKVDKEEVLNILRGIQPSNNPDNDIYRLLLVAACNHLNKLFPFLFERINDYTELLIPDDLTSSFSIVTDIYKGMSKDDCSEVEIIGWLYQFYISERNEKLIQSKKVYKKDEIAPASQLFTPDWIVQYMVDNTLGQYWSEIYPSTTTLKNLKFYIKPAYKEQLSTKEKINIEEIKFFDPCTGSGHILSYAFDVFYMMYEELGYSASEIPELIITKNLYGAEIDQRAAQLASFVLIMKGRQRYRRFFNVMEKRNIQPNIVSYQDFEEDEKFKNARVLGSLIKIESSEVDEITIETGTLFTEKQQDLLKQYKILGQRYDVVVTNPPYINSSRMEKTLKEYVNEHYPHTKSDLFATFIVRCLELCKEDGLTGNMTPFVWMFISSYEKLRKGIIQKHFINNLIQLEYSGFDGATVPICTFTLRNKPVFDAKGSYIRLSDFKGSENQAPKTLEAINNPQCGWFYIADQKNFEKVPGNRIGYWLNQTQIKSFEKDKTLEQQGVTRRGLQSGNSERFTRLWYEISQNNFVYPSLHSKKETISKKWVILNSGGNFRKWHGNLNNVVNWYKNGLEIKETSKAIIPNEKLYFNTAVVWNKITSGILGFRWQEDGIIPGDASPAFFSTNRLELKYILGFLNSKIIKPYLALFAPTLNAQVGDIKRIPIKKTNTYLIIQMVEKSINISKTDWDSRETSWDFHKNELIRLKGGTLKDTFETYMDYWSEQFYQLHANEEELNRQFIEIYGLQDKLTPDVPLEEVTILQDETFIEENELVFRTDEVMAQFISYAMGCMFGRYSLEKDGLVLANQGETLKDYLEKVDKPEQELAFMPDEDNIIPVLDDEWFADDIVDKFYRFLEVSFGKDNFKENLQFVEEALGKDVRRYFTRDFYTDHVKRYKKRPIYWLFSSPKGHFNALVYMHRYTHDTLSLLLNEYLKEFIVKLERQSVHLKSLATKGTAAEQNRAKRELSRIEQMLADCRDYEEILRPLALKRIPIDLDDGVLVNYNKMGSAVARVSGLNDKKAKEKVRKFDWIDTSLIKD